jgi:hypothetical protein
MNIENTVSRFTTKVQMPWHGWLGLALIVIFWPINWQAEGIRTAWAFFPLWLGFCLLVDSLAMLKNGSSLFVRSWKRYIGLFFLSMPGWWFFELINYRLQNWHYLGVESFSPLGFFLISSLNFSVVLPAVFSAAELFSGFGFIQRMKPWLIVRKSPAVTRIFFVAGWAMLAALLIWPKYCFPFAWISIYCILEPINIWMGSRSLADDTARGDWRPVAALFLGVLVTGFFWEMWNYLSYPKWVYTVPWVDFLHVFEMPVLGFGGYLPFSLELFAMYHLMLRLFGDRKGQGYIFQQRFK